VIGMSKAPSAVMPEPTHEVILRKAAAQPGVIGLGMTTPTSSTSPRSNRKRAEQLRSLSTQAAILDAALAEFSEKGFEAASIRAIADRVGVKHPLITHHFGNKEALWRAAAERTFARIREEWDKECPGDDMSSLDRLREEYRVLFKHTVAFPDFHRFMRQEGMSLNPRLLWVADHVLKPLIDRLLPQIENVQAEGLLPKVEPILFHYAMVSLTAALSEFGPEMQATRGLSAESPSVIDAYWRLVDQMTFGCAEQVSQAPKSRPPAKKKSMA